MKSHEFRPHSDCHGFVNKCGVSCVPVKHGNGLLFVFESIPGYWVRMNG